MCTESLFELRDFLQQLQVANDEVRFGHDAQLVAAMARKLFQNFARNFVPALRGLVRVGRSAQCNGFVRLYAAQFVTEQTGGMLLDVDFLLELQAIAHFHELMRVTGVAVAASELAAAIRIDGPCKRHLPIADAAVQQRLRRQREVFNLMAFT